MPSVFITGSNQGLGFETGRHLAKEDNIHLILSGRSEPKIKEAAEKLRAESGVKARIDYVVLDLTSDESIYAAAANVESLLGGAGLDVLVNNAAIALDPHIPDQKDRRKLLAQTYDTNVFGTIVVTEAFLPLLKKGTEPRIVNVGSGLGSGQRMSDPDYVFAPYACWAYSTSKSALQGLTITTARLNPDIHAVVVCPGHNATSLNGYSGAKAPSEGAKIIVKHSLRRTGKSPGYYDIDGEVPW